MNHFSSCVFTNSSPLCRTLDKAGVPADGKWRTLILYMRGIETYDFLSEVQKSQIQSLVIETLQQKDFSEENFQRIMRRHEEIIHSPCKLKLQAAISETAEMIEEFRKLLRRRGGDVECLGVTTVQTLEEGGDPEELIASLKDSFHQIVEILRRDADSLDLLSRTDALTGLMNRRALDDFLELCVERWKNEDKTFSMLMVDIDNFKNFNDRFGHRIGDQALVTIAKLISHQCTLLNGEGLECFSARYGGEEFTVVLPLVEEEQAEAIAEDLRDRVERYNFVIRDTDGEIIKRNIHITISIGVAEINPSWRGAYIENVVDAADRALYRAKAFGRNRVCGASQTPDRFALVSRMPDDS